MGKLMSDDSKQQQSCKTLKVMHNNDKSVKKRVVKVTYISSPLFVKACDASEFRSLVQQLTGKDSNHLIHEEISPPYLIQDPPLPTCSRVMQGGVATMAAEDGNASYYCYNNRLMDSVEFDEDYFWKEVIACSLQQPPYVLA